MDLIGSEDTKYKGIQYIENYLSQLYYPDPSRYNDFFSSLQCGSLIVNEYTSIIQSFSNIIKTDHYKVIDMKGQVESILTLNGDLYYDYGKLYQSISGYDLIVQGCTLDKEYIDIMETYFLSNCKKIGLNLPYLKAVRDSLIFGTIPFLDSNKENVWDFLKSIL